MDEPNTEIVRDWLTRADHDLQTTRVLTKADDALLDTAIYHCQPAAEQTVKGWLTANSSSFEKTHDIRRLVRQAGKILLDFSRLEKSAEILAPYASAFRYPGLTNDQMPSREEFDAALKDAQNIYDFVLNLLPKEARP